MKEIVLKQLSSLEKIFLDEKIDLHEEFNEMSALRGERISYQILYQGGEEKRRVKVFAEADLNIKTELRTVGNVPVALATGITMGDEYYLRKTPGLYPDVLYPLKDNIVTIQPNLCHSLFVTCTIAENLAPGTYPVKIIFKIDDETEYTKEFKIKVLNGTLPKQELTYTNWFHTDCIASYYKYEMYSEEHWQMIEKFIEKAAYIGVNMILTPMFTLPLDTEVGKERPTHQLVDVFRKNGKYSFGFYRLKRWIDICRKYGIEQFEMSHFFTQWGSGKTPKIVAETENGIERIFGWDVDAISDKYTEFLAAFVPELIDFLKKENVYDDTYFHISDEPQVEKDFDIYKQEFELITRFIDKDKFCDALSHYEFYEAGLVKKPVVITLSVDKFMEKGAKDIGAYYCCGPDNEGYSNRLISMPSGRARVMGMLLYRYGIDFFLHWGYNFYYSELSRRAIDPYAVTDADEAFSSGDSFIVYPGEDGPLESLRSVAFYEGLQDERACRMLGGFIGMDKVKKLLKNSGIESMNEYPRTNNEILKIREKINKNLAEILKNK